MVGLLLVEGHIDQRPILIVGNFESEPMQRHVMKVFFGVCGCTRPQTLRQESPLNSDPKTSVTEKMCDSLTL
jgi:hypothetical protein